MKKTALQITSLLLAIILLTSAIACSKSPASTDLPTDAPTDATESPTEKDTDPDEKPTEKPTEPKEPSLAPSVELGARAAVISASKPAIPATEGEEVDLSKYYVQFRTTDDPFTPDQVKWSSEQIEIQNGKFTPSEKGVYTLTATADGRSINVYLVVKAAYEDEYVLYYNDFESADALGQLTKASSSGGASYAIEDGKLVLKASGSANDSIRVLLPSWLSAFGDYTITSNTTITAKANESRWMGIMYRIQNNDFPYYQLCLRANANASNGVELSYQNASARWEYQTTTSYSESLNPEKLYEVTLKVSGNDADIYIDKALVGGGFGINGYHTGSVGMQASGSTAVFDDIKITLDFTPENVTALSPTIITKIESDLDLELLFLDPPQIVIMALDADGNVVDKDGSVIRSLADTAKGLPTGTIPAIELSTAYTYDVSATAALLRGLEQSDVMIISEDADLVKQLRSNTKSLISVVDFRNYDWPDGLIGARSIANSAGARICLLPNDIADQETTEFFNALNMTVWYESADDSVVDAFRLITSGANGIIANDRVLINNCLNSSVFAKNSILRPVGVIGHRGMPSQAPENTIAGSSLAAKYGANIIENDIYITRDGVLVVMHDGTIDRTTNGIGSIENFTYEQLCKYKVDDAPDESYSLDGKVNTPQHIPTLEEYFEEFKGTDTLIFIEIKSPSTARLVPALKKLIDKYDFYDQCSVICFSQDTLKAVKETIPELSVGYLCGSSRPSVIMNDTSNCTSSFNPSYGCVSRTLVKYLADRGIFTWPWTVNNSNLFDALYLMGVAGITTNYSNFAQKYVKRITADKTKYFGTVGKSIDVNIQMELYGAAKDAEAFENTVIPTNKAEMFVIEGNSTLTFDGTSVTATAAGNATVIFRLSFRLSNGETAYVYTQPVAINIK
jgi:glycerophosphoryl diester phosphodiesterase